MFINYHDEEEKVKDYKIKVLHVAETLMVDGRTTLLFNLIERTKDRFDHVIVTLKFPGRCEQKFKELKIPVYGLNMIKNDRPTKNFWKKMPVLYGLRPDICITWSGASKILSPPFKLMNIPLIWTIHNSLEKFDNRLHNNLFKIEKMLSKIVPDKIVCCSTTCYDVYRNIHKYPEKKLMVILSAVDTKKFCPASEKKMLRKQLNLETEAIVVASATRVKVTGEAYYKNFRTLIIAAGIAHKENPSIQFILFGHGVDEGNHMILDWIKEAKAEKCVQLLGVRDDVAKLFAASDILTMSSTSGEGLPLALLEGMATGAIPVCTDSGEIGKAILPFGRIVKQKDANELANAILAIAELSSEKRAEISKKAVDRVKEKYSIKHFAVQYSNLILDSVRMKIS